MYTHITPCKNGVDAIQYVLGGKNHKGHYAAERNLLVGGVNLLSPEVESYEDQFNRRWIHARKGHDIQARRIYISFSRNELNPDDPDSPYIAYSIVEKACEKFFPNRQVLICVQNDGESGLIHVHAIINDCDLISSKGCDTKQQKSWFIEKNFDEVAKEYFGKYGIEFDYGLPPKNRMSRLERAIAQGKTNKYSWEGDLKKRVRKSMLVATSRDEFLDLLADDGITISEKYTKRYGHYTLYVFKDYSNFESVKDIPKNSKNPDEFRVLKAKASTLGEDFEWENIDRHIAMNKKAALKSTSVSSGSNTDTSSGKSGEDQFDTYNAAMYMQLAGVSLKGLPYDEVNRITEEYKKKWAEFKEAYPDDYETRLYKGEIVLPDPVEEAPATSEVKSPVKEKAPAVTAPVKEKTPAVTVPVSDTVSTEKPTEEITEKSPEENTPKKKRGILEEKYKGTLDVVSAYDIKMGIDGYDPDWRKNRKGGREDLP